MSCTLVKEQCLQVGDHTVVIGEVLEAGQYATEKEDTGLVYLEGSYRRVGEVVNIHDEGP